jgi:hypothetical protein
MPGTLTRSFSEVAKRAVSLLDAEVPDGWCHPHWEERRACIREYLLRGPDSEFLRQKDLVDTMIIEDGGTASMWARAHVLIGDQAWQRFFMDVRDPEMGGLQRCQDLHFSAPTLLALYHMTRLHQGLNLFSDPPEVTVEIGGGFGNMTRLIRKAVGGRTQVIVDLPEMLAVQYLFLASVVGEDALATDHYAPGKINLVGLGRLGELDVQADLFVSTFALTETPFAFQQHIACERNYFEAPWVYITACRQDVFADPVQVEYLHSRARPRVIRRDWMDPRLYEVIAQSGQACEARI